MRQYKHKTPKYTGAAFSETNITNGDNHSHDGFRLHMNPDGSWLFLEGKRTCKRILSPGDCKKIDDCARRRGIKMDMRSFRGF